MTFLYLDGPTQYPERYGLDDGPSTLAQIVFVLIIVITFLLRKNQYFGWMWFVVKCFFIALFAVLLAGRIKSSIKDWLKD